jgi:hypothetical protein
MSNTPANTNQRRKSAAVAAPQAGSKRKGISKPSNLPNISGPRSLDARRSVAEPLADGDTQRDDGTSAQSILLKYNEIRGG